MYTEKHKAVDMVVAHIAAVVDKVAAHRAAAASVESAQAAEELVFSAP